MTAERKYFSGKTLEIALMQAARHHELEPEEVAYRKIEKRHGFLKARKGVVIVVDPVSPRKAAGETLVAEDEPVMVDEEIMAQPADLPDTSSDSQRPTLEEEQPGKAEVFEPEPTPEPTPEPEARERNVDEASPPGDEEFQTLEVTDDLVDAARRGLEEIMGFAKLDLSVEVSKGEGQLEIELSGPDRDRLVEDRGNLLLAIQHLLPRLIRGYTGRSIPCHVDSEDFHAKREVELEKLALEAAQEVVDRQQSRTLPPMNPAERRIIHVTLADNKEISTESQGKGFFKRVTLSPAMRRPRGFDRY